MLGDVIRAVPRVVVLNSPLPYIKVLSGSTVDFTWKFRVFEEKMIKAISWYYSVSDDNWTDSEKLVQKTFKVNHSNEVSGNPLLKPEKRNRTSCTFDHQDQILTMNCRLTNAKAYDSVSYGMKVKFRAGTTIVITNTSTLKVVGKLTSFE